MLKIIPSTEVPPPDPDAAPGLLAPFLPNEPALVLLAGEASAGKTVLARSLAYHLAEGLTFVGLSPREAVPVLYVDLESPEGLFWDLVKTIGWSDNLGFIRELDRPLSDSRGLEDLKDAIKRHNAKAVFIDPLPMAWPVRDENDNAEADRQMTAMKHLAVETNCVVVVLWNMGEGFVKEKFRARGATARVDRPDLVLNYTELARKARRLKVVKSRYGTREEEIVLGFAEGLKFEVREAPEPLPTTTSQIKSTILSFVTGSEPKERQDIINEVRAQGIEAGDNLIDKALGELVSAGELVRAGRGKYKRNLRI